MQVAETSKKTRVRTVFPVNELAHVWANGNADYGTVSNRSFYFEGDTIYSYGRHYPIATKYNVRGQNVILMNNQTASSFTSKHKGKVLSAIDTTFWTVLDVVAPSPSTSGFGLPSRSDIHAENVQDMVSRLAGAVADQRNTRKRYDGYAGICSIMSHLSNYLHLFEEADTKFRGLLKAALKYEGAEVTQDLKSEWADVVLDFGGRVSTYGCSILPEDVILANTLMIPSNTVLAELQEIGVKKETKRVERETKNNAEAIDKWLAGNRQVAGYKLPYVMLRRVDDMVETSLGVKVKVSEALKLFDVLHRVRTSVMDKSLDVTKFVKDKAFPQIAGYDINKVTPDGDLKAGCHFIQWAEIERFAKLQKWIYYGSSSNKNRRGFRICWWLKSSYGQSHRFVLCRCG